MTHSWQTSVPEPLHDAVRTALAAVYGGQAVESLGPILGGASGAIALRMRSRDRDHLLRVEVHKHPARNPHQYRCMRIAAEAGLAPPLHYVDEGNGVAVMDFIPALPLAQYPGGRPALFAALGALAKDLQATPVFPELWDFRQIAGRLLALAEGRFEPGLLAPHREAFERLLETLEWDPSHHVSSHNDPNPRNVLFDGQRLWLIDWETAYRNDPFVDAAILTDTHGAAQEEADALLGSWLGRPAADDEKLRLAQATALTRLYYAGLLFAVSGPQAAPLANLDAPSPAEFATQVTGVAAPSPEILLTMAKMRLRDFLAGCAELGGT